MDGIGRFGRFMRDQAYDVVFEVGDTSLQFIGDMLRGYNEDRHRAFAHRQIARTERRHMPKVTPTPATNEEAPKPTPQKPLSFSEKQAFAAMMGRQSGESIIEHWKRQKALLAYPDKQALIAHHKALQMRVKKEKMQEDEIQVEMRSIASRYQKQHGLKQKPMKKRGKKRVLKR